jgi:NRPS condensation-like uncharacterized protein
MIYSSRCGQHEHANFVLTFDGRLDARRLRDAMRLAMDAEPVFGCRYVPGRKPHWERRTDLDSLPLCTLTETGNFSRELERFVATPCDGTRDPLLSTCIVRGETDALFFKTSHLAADGAGCKELLSLVAGFFRDPKRATHRAVPNVGSRGAGQLFSQTGWRECLRILRQPTHKRAKDIWCFPTVNRHDSGGLRFVLRRLEPATFDALRVFGKRFDATLNNVFVAACFRALWRFLDFPPAIPQSIVIPTDARQYLRHGRTEAICNFTAPLHATIERITDEPFDQTLTRIRNCPLAGPARRERALAALFWISVLYHLSRSRVERSFEAALKGPSSQVVFTNVGAFDPDQFDFGVPLTDIYRISQAAIAPGLLIAVSSFRRKLTFAINYPSRAIRPEDIERFFDIFIEELQSAAEATLSPATPETAHPAPHLPNRR